MRGVRLFKCTNSFKEKKKKSRHILALGTQIGTGCSLTREVSTGRTAKAGPPALDPPWRPGKGPALPSGSDDSLGPWPLPGTVKPPSTISKSFPSALVDLCGLELIMYWESETTQPFPCGGATTVGQVAKGVGRGWW